MTEQEQPFSYWVQVRRGGRWQDWGGPISGTPNGYRHAQEAAEELAGKRRAAEVRVVRHPHGHLSNWS